MLLYQTHLDMKKKSINWKRIQWF